MPDHAVERVDRLVRRQPRQAEEQIPEQRRHYAVAQILARRLDGGPRRSRLVEALRVAPDEPADAAAPRVQARIETARRVEDGVVQTAPGEQRAGEHGFDQPSPGRGVETAFDEPARQRRAGDKPRGRRRAAPRAVRPFPVEAPVERRDRAPEHGDGVGDAAIQPRRVADSDIDEKGEENRVHAATMRARRDRGQTRRRGRDAMSAKTGVMICGHGSRDEDAIAEFTAFARAMAERLPEHVVESGFLEFARPVIRDGLDALCAAGVERILAVPGMLFAAGHAKNDIPSVLNAWAAERLGPPVDYARELGIDPKLVRAAGARVEAALAAAGDPVPRADTALVVVGRGASDPDANANVAKVMRLLWEGLGLGWGETAYSGVTFPVVAPALDRVARLGFRRVVVFPWFLFTGVLVKRIYAHTDRAAARYPEIEFLKASYLADHPLAVETAVDRVGGLLRGDNAMNCRLCKYREPALGFEDEVGLPQRGHHHHVEGVGAGEAHDRGHTHTHHPYPHAAHPLGPAGTKTRRA